MKTVTKLQARTRNEVTREHRCQRSPISCHESFLETSSGRYCTAIHSHLDYRSHSSFLTDKKVYVESAFFPLLQQTPDLDSPAIVRDTLRDTIADLKFCSTLEVNSRSHLGLSPLAFAQQSQSELPNMEREAALRDRTANISAKNLKTRKVPLAPGTPSDLRDLVAGMFAGY
jgi:hypothetical protein